MKPKKKNFQIIKNTIIAQSAKVNFNLGNQEEINSRAKEYVKQWKKEFLNLKFRKRNLLENLQKAESANFLSPS